VSWLKIGHPVDIIHDSFTQGIRLAVQERVCKSTHPSYVAVAFQTDFCFLTEPGLTITRGWPIVIIRELQLKNDVPFYWRIAKNTTTFSNCGKYDCGLNFRRVLT